MQAIVEILERLESVIYKIIIWVVLIPKTLFKIVLEPLWAPTYIKQELNEGKSRFDEYFSPIILLLVVALLPFVIWNFIPSPGVTVTSPAVDNPTSNRSLDFDAKIRFTSTHANGYVTTFWRVEKEVFVGDEYYYPTLVQDRFTNNPGEINSQDYFDYYQVDNHTLQDIYDYRFTEAGNYWVVINASKFDKDHKLIETYKDDIFIYVPENAQENVSVYTKRKPGESNFTFEDIANQLKSEKTILLALGMLIPPLLFALVIKLFGGDDLSEDTLKETFYVQCYYFSPLAFMFWATRYAIRFITPDVFFRFDTKSNLIILLPIILSVFWFVSVQTHAVYDAAKEHKKKTWLALPLVLVCMIVIGAGILFIVYGSDPIVQEIGRKSAIWLYPVLAVGLLSMYHIRAFLRRRKEKKSGSAEKKDEQTDIVLAYGIVLIILIAFFVILLQGRSTSLTDQNFDVTQQSIADQSIEDVNAAINALPAPEATQDISQAAAPTAAASLPQPTVTVTETLAAAPTIEATSVTSAPSDEITSTPEQYALIPSPSATMEQKYYTEEFDGNLDTWPYFLTQGDESSVNYHIDSSKLYFQLTPQDEKKPWAYLVNKSFKYTDVQLETSTTNNGANSNGVSLVCRYSDAGWYEFLVSNGGTYTIYAYDGDSNFYHELASGGSAIINTGSATNVYTAICKGSELTLMVNGKIITTTNDKRFNFTEGLIGLAVSSPQGLPVSVDFDYIKVSEPQ